MLDDILPGPFGAVSRLPVPPVTVIFAADDDSRPVGEPPPRLAVMDSRLRVTDRHLHPRFRAPPPPESLVVPVPMGGTAANVPTTAPDEVEETPGRSVAGAGPLPAGPIVNEQHRHRPSESSSSERSSPARTDELPGSPESSELSSILTGDGPIDRIRPIDYPPGPRRTVRRRRFTKHRPARCRTGAISGSLPRRGSGSERTREEDEFLASVLQEHPRLFADEAAATAVRASPSLASELMVAASIQQPHAGHHRSPPGRFGSAFSAFAPYDETSDPGGLFDPSFTAHCSRA